MASKGVSGVVDRFLNRVPALPSRLMTDTTGVDSGRSPAAPNVVLTGFMGTGKSSVGRMLAARLRYEWVDTDVIIESRHGPIHEIFSNNGEEAFRDLGRSLADELAGRDGLVISTGGRMMLDGHTADVLGAGARVFCLTASTTEILRRVTDQGAQRPLLADTHPAERIAGLLAERDAAYRRFEQVGTDGKSTEDVVADLLARLQSTPTPSDTASQSSRKSRGTEDPFSATE